MTGTGIGAPVRRKEDQRFITGQGRYTDDLTRPGQAHAAFVRSPHAHARIVSIDTSAASAMPGVVAILTGDDLAADKIGGLICGWMIHSKDGSPMKAGPHPALAQGKVRYVGDHVAVVIADTLAQARDAVEAVAVEYEPLPAIADTARARGANAVVHDEAPDNVVYEWHLGDKGATEAAFAKAAHVTRLDITNNRLIPNPMETRAAIGEYDAGTGGYTLYTTSQNPHVARLVLSAFIGIAPEHQLRVIAPDVGGGFGSKIFIYAEETVCVWAARRGPGARVKWTSGPHRGLPRPTRTGATTSPIAEMAVDEAARSSAFASTPSPISAPTSRPSPPRCRPTSTRRCCRVQYDIPAIYAEVERRLHQTPPPSTPIAAPAARRRTYVVRAAGPR